MARAKKDVPPKEFKTPKDPDPSKKKKRKSGLKTLTYPRHGGSPTRWSQEVEDRIVKRLSLGIPLRAICREEGMPTFFTVYDWMERDSEFDKRIAHAREIGWESIAQECIEIAHDERHDYALTKRGPVFRETHVQRAKLQIETRLKLLSKWLPKRYGDKIEVNGVVGFTALPDLLAQARAIRAREAAANGEILDIETSEVPANG